MIFDIFGRIIKTYNIKTNQNQIEIDVKKLTPGTYYIKCKDTTNGFSTTNKLIIQ
ncbi:MAG: hypothetical protein H6Q16_1231 [Bacteroidetes bacterium]|nr:hypothetical protein [Bacteroidota bacterium]